MRFPKHPIPIHTVFRRCFLVNFAVDPSELASVLPAHIEPDVRDGEAYLSVVVGEMERLRPLGVPRLLGFTYDQIVYRAVVRCGDERGVHFLRSDADSRTMTILGNLMSFFRFHRSRVRFTERGDELDLDVTTRSTPAAGIAATYTTGAAADRLPATSVFADLNDAKRFLVELYAAFLYEPGSDSVDVVRIERGEWNIRIVDDRRARYDFMTAGAPFTSARLDSVFWVGDVPYRWHRLQRKPIAPSG